jgi:2-methylcitrate dehydratase
MTIVEDLAEFAASRTFNDLSEEVIGLLKIRVLDSLGCGIGALDAPPVKSLQNILFEFGGAPHCTLIGGEGKTSPDQATFHNGALIRYLDFNDSYLAKNETCHPSDNVAPVLAASEYAAVSGKDLLVALAVAYEVQCRLSESAPVRAKGFDHTVQGSYAVAAGASRALKLDPERTANAIAISGTALNALRVTRTGKLSNWKGLAYPFMASNAIKATFLAKDGVTGPLEVFEGNKGFMDTIAGPFKVDWHSEGLDLVNKTIIKNYNAEIHSQSAIACMLKLRNRHGLSAEDLDRAEVRIFDVAFNIIGGGEEGEKKESIETKEQADHSLPYILAVALLDGKVLPEEYELERINSRDVQALLKRIHIKPDKEFSTKFPAQMPCEITVHTKSGKTLVESSVDYDGFYTRPFTWEETRRKFEALSARYLEEDASSQIENIVFELDKLDVSDLAIVLEKAKRKKSPT